MYIYIHTYIYTYVYISMCVLGYAHIYIYTHMDMYMHTRICRGLYTTTISFRSLFEVSDASPLATFSQKKEYITTRSGRPGAFVARPSAEKCGKRSIF